MLQGIKVIDFTNLLPGPYATMMLADLGAEVVNVISANHPNLLKLMVPQVGDNSVWYLMLQRNKKHLEIDLKSVEGKQQIKEIIKTADVIIEGFRPGVMKRLELDYEAVKTYNEDIIYCSLTGYGHNNSMSDRAGHDINYQALSGMSVANKTDGIPRIAPIPLADLAAGSLHAVIGILSAIINRLQTGEGQFVDVSMTDASIALSFIDLIPKLNHHLPNTPGITVSDLLGGQSFYSYYKCSDDQYLAVGSIEPKFFKKMLLTLGLDETNYNHQFDPLLQKHIADKLRQHPVKHLY